MSVIIFLPNMKILSQVFFHTVRNNMLVGKYIIYGFLKKKHFCGFIVEKFEYTEPNKYQNQPI